MYFFYVKNIARYSSNQCKVHAEAYTQASSPFVHSQFDNKDENKITKKRTHLVFYRKRQTRVVNREGPMKWLKRESRQNSLSESVEYVSRAVWCVLSSYWDCSRPFNPRPWAQKYPTPSLPSFSPALSRSINFSSLSSTLIIVRSLPVGLEDLPSQGQLDWRQERSCLIVTYSITMIKLWEKTVSANK